MRLEDADWFAGLHEQGFVVGQILQRLDDGAVGFPTARGASGSSVNDKVFRTLGDFFVEVVHEHAHGGFLLPAFTADLIATGRTNRSG